MAEEIDWSKYPTDPSPFICGCGGVWKTTAVFGRTDILLKEGCPKCGSFTRWQMTSETKHIKLVKLLEVLPETSDPRNLPK